ncbi:MAG: diadenosine tetraphosphate hydrolase [Candidatus Portnoybacteria bacterium CG10_big_fil_rev_8_21_14_0_10_44_7]|uniref:Bis(5'-nucleosyl)-tetraphosphatase [asymmetrical] n=1 Tax=Candidatus Portnoybacteria bacterium CG10_big_fil_rev_8_21_14_0_10_44_7 TaxID=1974816 RepID=A0A2M8KJB5_9BACT|nr:MAG: diadenosine tetraphosphate hydrolase [Candidatus Portnoybacteria bacterium CG10_big_fil_rev_8_21_14_0_10_44_7]
MPVEKSAGAVVFYRAGQQQIEYLLIKSSRAGHWGLPKGLIEANEKLEETALREVKEETGLKYLTLIDGFKETIRWYFKVKYGYQLKRGLKIGEGVLKFATFFLLESKDKKVKLSFEHSDFVWLPYVPARKKVLGSGKKILEKAEAFLTEKN